MADKMTPEQLRDYITRYKEINAELARERDILFATNQLYESRAKQSQINLNNEQALNNLKENRNILDEEGKKLLNALEKSQKGVVNQTEKEYKQRQKILRILGDINSSFHIGWKYLQDSDKVIKSTILNLGMSGAKAEMMRTSFENSAQYVARLGGELKDVQSIMEGYADATGKVRALSEETVKSVMAIGKGTGLGVEEATRLAAQFEFMGKDAISTLEYVQGVVDTSERMGVNTTKVLKNVSTNFKKLSTFTFQGGTKAFAQMAIDAERTRLSMETALNVAEATRGLEAVIELGANLQVMGGEFAKIDPLHWLYTVRNEPEKLNNMISEMTKGLFTLRKTSDGTFERFISPADRDRLANVAKSLGISNEEMFQMAQRSAEISSMQRDLSRLGLNKEQQELVEGIAKFDSKSGKMVVEIGRTAHAVSDLTSEQIKLFVSEQKTLEERAKEARTFDETFRATINELKASILPLLDTINGILKIATPIFENVGNYLNWFSKNLGAIGAALSGAQIIAAAVILKAAGRSVGRWINEAAVNLFTTKKGAAARGVTSTSTADDFIRNKDGRPNIGATRARDVGRVNRMRAAGTRNLKTGAGIGVAGLGVGAGIGAGAMGIAQLAKAVKDVDVEKLKQMNITLGILAGTMIGFGIAGVVAAKATLPLMAIGGAVALIGVGIGAAAYGMSFLAESLGNVSKKTSGSQLLGIAGGITAIAASTALMMNPLSIGGLGVLTGVMGAMSLGYSASSKSAESMTNMATAMKGSERDFLSIEKAVTAINLLNKKNVKLFSELGNVGNNASIKSIENLTSMATAMSGTKEDFLSIEKAIAAINSLDIKNANIFSDLAKIISQPLKVQFDEGSVNLKNDITLEIDRTNFMNKIFDAKLAVQLIERERIGKR